jgi:hypothetical protein
VNVQRIYTEVRAATASFALVEAHPTSTGGVFVKAGFQTSAGNTYITAIHFTDYPSCMPKVYVTAPTLPSSGIHHRYPDGHICYLHPSMWNPGVHNLTFVLARTAKWLNKYEILRLRGYWPGAEMPV